MLRLPCTSRVDDPSDQSFECDYYLTSSLTNFPLSDHCAVVYSLFIQQHSYINLKPEKLPRPFDTPIHI